MVISSFVYDAETIYLFMAISSAVTDTILSGYGATSVYFAVDAVKNEPPNEHPVTDDPEISVVVPILAVLLTTARA